MGAKCLWFLRGKLMFKPNIFKKNFFNFFISGIAASFLPSCVTTGQTIHVDRGYSLTGEQIRQVVSDASMYGVYANGGTYYEFHGEDGSYRFQSSRPLGLGYVDDQKKQGRWNIEGNLICYHFSGRDVDECVEVLLSGNSVQFANPSTGKIHSYTTRIEGGGGLPSRQSNSPKAPVQDAIPVMSKDLAALSFSTSSPQPNDIAIIIGNADYSKGQDIPNVTPAYLDAEGMRVYVRQALGISDENIIFLKDASQAELISTFGSETNPEGQLSNYVKFGKSRVFVYFSGHGAPGRKDGGSYIVPVDAQASLIELNGYPLKTLYKNLSKLSAKSVTVVLEACFSGASQSGSVIAKASPIYLNAKETDVPSNITVIAAGAANQIASWEQDSSSGLFTKYFLKGMSGEADAKPYGNGDGKVGYDELGRYFKETLTYYARRYYGREQTAQIVVGGG